jgi:hypothetical protein
MRLLSNPTLRLFIGASLISLSPVWVKLVSVSPTTSAFWRLAIGGLVIAAYLLLTRRRLHFSTGVWAVIVLAGVPRGRSLVLPPQYPAHRSRPVDPDR